jgi:AraC family transcriptional regulator of adaptative response/methylated-DNA-[protein]-cysteine methyltransferase
MPHDAPTDTLVYTTHATSIGTLLLVASHRGLRYVTLLASPGEVEEKLRNLPQATLVEAHSFLASACTAIDRYLADGTELKLPIDLAGGTPLQRMVWLAIAKIPYGETISYTTLAERVGFPRAVRAVASACGANPVPLAIACHRVLAKDGTLGGFSLGGVEVKEVLLALEQQQRSAAA